MQRGAKQIRKILLVLQGQSRGEGKPLHFPETNCKRRLGRSLPGHNPGLRKTAEIRERKYRATGERSVTLTLLHAKKSLIL